MKNTQPICLQKKKLKRAKKVRMSKVLLDSESAFPLMEKFNNEVFKNVFPNSVFFQRYFAGSLEGSFRYNNLFSETIYFTDLNQTLLHFTSLQSLSAILQNGFFRLSEFGHFDDVNELHFANKVFEENEFLKLKQDNIDKQKSNCFALSACLDKDEAIKNSFMWEKYANHSKGVIIKFKLSFNKTHNFLLGKIQYGVEQLKPIVALKDLAEKFRNENNGFVYDNFPERIIEFLAYHKHNKFISENEVRLFFREEKFEYKKHNHEAIYEDINSRNEVRYFFKTFLIERKSVLENEVKDKELSDEYFQHYPTIKIEKIILGNNLSNEQKSEVADFLITLKTRFNYSYTLEHINNENEIFVIY